MFRFTIRDLPWLVVLTITGGLVGGAISGAVTSDPVETVYQWMRGIVCGGLLAAIVSWIGRASWPIRPPEKSSGQP